MSNHTKLEDIIELFLDRFRAGDVPTVDEFIKQYPQHASDLAELLPLLLEMERASEKRMAKVTPVNTTIPEMPGSDYRLLKKIGQGGMGLVFEAIQMSLNRKVAVKLLASTLVADKRQREQFEREAQIVAMLHHPNIVKIFSVENRPEYCCYAMELIDGQGLNRYKIDDLRHLAGIGIQAAQALAYAHRCNVIHSDIKPANLLLDANQVLHVSDFGLALVLQNNNEAAADRRAQSGTLRYMAPERLLKGTNTFLSDQYSLGITLYELITRVPVLQGCSAKELYKGICDGAIPPLKCAEPDLAAIINKSISINPDDRYKCMDDFACDLQHFLNREPIEASAASCAKRLILWTKRKPAIAVSSLIAALFSIAFVVALAVGFVRTSAALRLAQQNAEIADTSMSNIFNYIEEQIPSDRGTILFSALMPYYQGIAQQRNLSRDKMAEMNNSIGICALRTGNYPLAESAFRQLIKYRTDAYPLNQLAEVLRKQNKIDEANNISRQVVADFTHSSRKEDRFETVRALKALSTKTNSKDMEQALQLIKLLLQYDPTNPEYLFLYATILGDNPLLFRLAKMPGVEPNPVILLNELSKKFPDRLEYGLALVDLMYHKLRNTDKIKSKDNLHYEIARKLSDQLLGHFPNSPNVVSSTVQFRVAYAELLRKDGKESEAKRETERLLGTLEILFYNPDIPDVVQECLIQMQFQQLEDATREKDFERRNRLISDLRNELTQYKGKQAKEFRSRLTGVVSMHE